MTAVYFPDNKWFVKGIKSGLVTGRAKIKTARTTEVSVGDEHILEQLEKLVRGEPLDKKVLPTSTGSAVQPELALSTGAALSIAA